MNEASIAATLIICSRNRPQLLRETMTSLMEGSQLPAEVVIIDQSDRANESLVGLTEVRGCRIRYNWSQTIGLSHACNLGIRLASHEILVFTHDDVVVPHDWFELIIKAVTAAGPRSIVTGQVCPTEPQTASGFAPTVKIDPNPAIYRGLLSFDVLFPLNMAMYRSAFDEVGGFDERLGPGTRFPGAEDSDMGFRLLGAGYSIVYNPNVIIYHKAWRTARDYLPLRWSYGLARGAFYAKHVRQHGWHMLRRTWRDVVIRATRTPWRFRSERRQAEGDLVLASGIVWGAILWLLTQRGRAA